MPTSREVAVDLAAFVDAAPSPYHAVAEAARRLAGAGFTGLEPAGRWPEGPGAYFVARGGSLIAWVAGEAVPADAPLAVVAAHTDSPTLRVKPRPDSGRAGWRQLGVEVYGGALTNSWLDRDLGLAGRVVLAGRPRSGDLREVLLTVDRPVLRIPQLAIHLDREVRERGLLLNAQQHLAPVWGVGPVVEGDFVAFLAEQLRAEPGEVLGFELGVYDLTPARLVGRDEELLAAGRLDNLSSCHAALTALAAAAADPPTGRVPVVVLADHEEVGSQTATGAASGWIPAVLERAATGRGAGREEFLRGLAGSLVVSADLAHATHPNYADRHEPGHQVHVNAGPVLKINANGHYATDATTQAVLTAACRDAGVALQTYVVRSDLPCGSTVGPILAAALGVPAVDVGIAGLAMHSARELVGAADPALLTAALTAFFAAG